MNDFSILMILFALMNKNGFNSIKNAIKAADSFSSQICNISNIMNMLPMLNGVMNSQKAGSETNYVDTLKDILSGIK